MEGNVVDTKCKVWRLCSLRVAGLATIALWPLKVVSFLESYAWIGHQERRSLSSQPDTVGLTNILTSSAKDTFYPLQVQRVILGRSSLSEIMENNQSSVLMHGEETKDI